MYGDNIAPYFDIFLPIYSTLYINLPQFPPHQLKGTYLPSTTQTEIS